MNKRVSLILAAVLVGVVTVFLLPAALSAGDPNNEGQIERIGPEETRKMVADGQALLVCAYSDKRCESILLEGAVLRGELDDQISSLPKDRSLIFYCG